MAVQDNSPNRTYIRWSHVKIISNNIYYPVSDGYTSDRYVYWKSQTPYELVASNTFPEDYDEIVFLNNNGVCRVYPSSNIIIDGNHMFDNTSSISEHVNNGVLHMSMAEKNALRNISDKTFEHGDMINTIGSSTIELQKMGLYLKDCISNIEGDMSVLEGLVSMIDKNVVDMNDEVKALGDVLSSTNETMSHLEGVVDTINREVIAITSRMSSVENRILNLENQIGGVSI